MRAMILAAGLGTRLRPLTLDRPKALVEVAGHPLLEITLRRLREFGIREVIVNVHHFADLVIDYLKKNNNFGMRIEISREVTLLDTGGGLQRAAWFFLEGGADEPLLLHNVDVLSTIDFGRMVDFHKQNQAFATLAVQERETSRPLLFDEKNQLCGRRVSRDQAPEMVREAGEIKALAFSGVHVISPRVFELMTEKGAYSIITSYLRLAGMGKRILGFRADQYYWRDLGKVGSIAQAMQDVERKVFQV